MKKTNKVLKFIFLFASLASFSLNIFAASPSVLHNYHTSLTRIDYNADQKIFEISIQLFLHDLTPLLEKKMGSRVNIEKSADVDKMLLKYLNEEFVLKDKSGIAKELKWVGKELDVDSVWIYLETPSSESLEGYSLQNTIFFRDFPEQANLVLCRFDDNKADLVFTAGDKTKDITANNAKPDR